MNDLIKCTLAGSRLARLVNGLRKVPVLIGTAGGESMIAIEIGKARGNHELDKLPWPRHARHGESGVRKAAKVQVRFAVQDAGGMLSAVIKTEPRNGDLIKVGRRTRRLDLLVPERQIRLVESQSCSADLFPVVKIVKQLKNGAVGKLEAELLAFDQGSYFPVCYGLPDYPARVAHPCEPTAAPAKARVC